MNNLERRIDVSYETVRRWALKFATLYAPSSDDPRQACGRCGCLLRGIDAAFKRTIAGGCRTDTPVMSLPLTVVWIGGIS